MADLVSRSHRAVTNLFDYNDRLKESKTDRELLVVH